MTGHLEFFGQRLQRTRNFGNFRGPVFLAAFDLHQLQIVDHDQAETVLAMQASRPRTDLGRRQAGRVVDVNGRIRHQLHGGIDSRPVFIREVTGAKVRLIDAAQRGNHAKRQLLRRHFHRENRGRHLRADRRVLGDIDSAAWSYPSKVDRR